jgi:hypothetical protein
MEGETGRKGIKTARKEGETKRKSGETGTQDGETKRKEGKKGESVTIGGRDRRKD